MDVSLTPKMQQALESFLDAAFGDEPSRLMIGPGARRVREARKQAREFMHRFAALAMRVGGGRALQEKGYPTVGSDATKPWTEFHPDDKKNDQHMVEAAVESQRKLGMLS